MSSNSIAVSFFTTSTQLKVCDKCAFRQGLRVWRMIKVGRAFRHQPATRYSAIRTLVLNLHECAEPLCNFPSFCRTSLLPNMTKKNEWYTKATMVSLRWCNHAFRHDSDDLRRTSETTPRRNRGVRLNSRSRTMVKNHYIRTFRELMQDTFVWSRILRI